MKIAAYFHSPFGLYDINRHATQNTRTEAAPLAGPIVYVLAIFTLGLTAATAYLLWAKVSSLWPFL